MKQIENYIDSLVKKIKEDSVFDECVFVKGFSALEFPNPNTSYMIAVSTLDSTVSVEFCSDNVGEDLSGSIFNSTVKFRVYSKKNEGGDGLLALCTSLCDVIRKNDNENMLTGITISSIAFDNDAMTVYRDVVASLSFCLYEEVKR